VPDPQYLSFVNPRISDVGSDITTEYEAHAQFVKLLLHEGEIDFVVSPNLTVPGYDQWTLLVPPRRPVRRRDQSRENSSGNAAAGCTDGASDRVDRSAQFRAG
jgi:hypothetical protein